MNIIISIIKRVKIKIRSIWYHNKVLNLLAYICSSLISKEVKLSPKLIIQVLYLCDWKASLTLNKQVTNIKWRIIDSEPIIDDKSIHNIVDFISKRKIMLRFLFSWFISKEEKRVVKFVIETVTEKNENELAQLVYSTYPSITQDEADEVIDMPKLADRYNKEIRPLISV